MYSAIRSGIYARATLCAIVYFHDCNKEESSHSFPPKTKKLEWRNPGLEPGTSRRFLHHFPPALFKHFNMGSRILRTLSENHTTRPIAPVFYKLVIIRVNNLQYRYGIIKVLGHLIQIIDYAEVKSSIVLRRQQRKYTRRQPSSQILLGENPE
jgi:hypothetical protein